MSVRLYRALLLLSTFAFQFTGTGAQSSSSAAVSQNVTANAETAFQVLQTWYNTSTGIWDTTGWWNGANCLTVIGDLAALDSSVKSQVTAVYANSITAAASYNLGLIQTKIVLPDYNILTLATYLPQDSVNPKGFLNGFYDDEGWWALGWIQAFDVTGTADYLNTAIDIFNDMKNGSTTPCTKSGSGIWWDKAETYVNAIANELYLSVAAHLANRESGNKSFYTSIAQEQWTWFQGTGMINAQGTINDGLTTACANNNGTVWSYNQGVVLGALVELNKATGNTSYITSANNIATAAIKTLSDSDGVLHDPCEPDCGADGSQFKGIFLRGLQKLQTVSPSSHYVNFIATNAASIWANDMSNGKLSEVWSGPFVAPANASTQSSAMDALVAAIATQGQAGNGISSGRRWNRI